MLQKMLLFNFNFYKTFTVTANSYVKQKYLIAAVKAEGSRSFSPCFLFTVHESSEWFYPVEKDENVCSEDWSEKPKIYEG